MTLKENNRSVIIDSIEYENDKLKTPASATTLPHDLTIIFNNPAFPLIDHTIPVSKSLLKRCPFFRKMLDSKFREANADKVDIKFEVDDAIFYEILEYIKTGKIVLSTRNLEGICRLASYLMLTDLTQFCCNVFKQNINCETVDYIHAFANDKSFPGVSGATVIFKKKNFQAILKNRVFLEWDITAINELLCSDFVVLSEKKVLMFVLDWLLFEISKRFKNAAELFGKLRFSHLKKETIDEVASSGELGQILSQVAKGFSGKVTPPRIYGDGIYLLGLSDKKFYFDRYCPTDKSIDTLKSPEVDINADVQMVVCNNDIYVLSSLRDDKKLHVHVYDQLADTWTARTSTKFFDRYYHRACGFESKIYVFVRRNVLHVMIYCCATDSWSSKPIQIPMHTLDSAVTCGDSIYLIAAKPSKIVRFNPSNLKLSEIHSCESSSKKYGVLAFGSELFLVADGKDQLVVLDPETANSSGYSFSPLYYGNTLHMIKFKDSIYLIFDPSNRDGESVYKFATIKRKASNPIEFSRMDWVYFVNMSVKATVTIE